MTTVLMDKFKKSDTQIEKTDLIDETIIATLDKRLNRKFDIHILPWLFGIW
jgi:hypothetical protein